MFKLKIHTNNDAFNDGNDGRIEIIRLLQEVAKRLEVGGDRQWTLIDCNGNSVGTVHFHS